VTARTDRLLLVNAIMGQFVSGFGSRLFIVALPTIAGTLNADILGISWALIAYQLAGISLSVVFGRLGDVRGRYAIYGGGFAIMAASSLLCGVAPNVGSLVLFRFVQGIGAAMLASAARVLAMESMPEGSEGRANGFMTMAFHSGFLLGPPLGGLVIDLVSLPEPLVVQLEELSAVDQLHEGVVHEVAPLGVVLRDHAGVITGVSERDHGRVRPAPVFEALRLRGHSVVATSFAAGPSPASTAKRFPTRGSLSPGRRWIAKPPAQPPPPGPRGARALTCP
jgi:hypothetical protein